MAEASARTMDHPSRSWPNNNSTVTDLHSTLEIFLFNPYNHKKMAWGRPKDALLGPQDGFIKTLNIE
jgi:hypothetical protein